MELDVDSSFNVATEQPVVTINNDISTIIKSYASPYGRKMCSTEVSYDPWKDYSLQPNEDPQEFGWFRTIEESEEAAKKILEEQQKVELEKEQNEGQELEQSNSGSDLSMETSQSSAENDNNFSPNNIAEFREPSEFSDVEQPVENQQAPVATVISDMEQDLPASVSATAEEKQQNKKASSWNQTNCSNNGHFEFQEKKT